jgi:hypothetical protein
MWRRAAGGAQQDVGQEGNATPSSVQRPLFRGQFLARGMAALSRLRQPAGQPPAQGGAEEPTGLNIDIGTPDSGGAGPGDFQFAPVYDAPAYDAPAFTAPANGDRTNSAPSYGTPDYGAPRYGAPAGGIPAPQIPTVPPETESGGPEINIELDAPSSAPASSARQRSVLAPRKSPRGG